MPVNFFFSVLGKLFLKDWQEGEDELEGRLFYNASNSEGEMDTVVGSREKLREKEWPSLRAKKRSYLDPWSL